jgi:flavin reductase (DIM6/NTAB) family NADH-FMN oxidoreductase RutF
MPEIPSTPSPPPPDDFRSVLSRIPTAVTVIATTADGSPSGATANAVVSLSLSPPLMLAALDRGSRTLDAVRRAGRFAINVLAADQADLARRFATKDPHPEKWAGVPWQDKGGMPLISGTLAWIGCELRELHDGGDHVILVGAVVEVEASDGEPLIFLGGYRGLGTSN